MIFVPYDIIKRKTRIKNILRARWGVDLFSCGFGAVVFSGLICISPAFASKLHFSLLTYFNIGLALFFNPKRHFPVPITPQMCTQDIEYQKVIDSDPLDKHTSTARLYWNIFKAQQRVKSLTDKVISPLLVLTAGEDTVVDSLAICKIFNSLKTKDKELINYPAMRHSLSIESGREKVFGDILRWIEERTRGSR